MIPLVTVIVTHHLDENQKYLDLCLKGIEAQSGTVPFETIVLSDAPTCPEVPSWATLVHNTRLNTATKKGHFGISLSDPRSKYFLFHSDDVVMSKGCLKSMVEAVGSSGIICNPMSNSDNGSRFLSPDYPNPDRQWEDYKEYAPMSGRLLIPQDWVSFYCTLIPRDVWTRVGDLDEKLEVRGNDLDFCIRARQHGIIPVINFNAFAFHFGSVTLRKTVTPEQYKEADEAFREKYRL